MMKNYKLKTGLTFLLACLLLRVVSFAQTTLINPATDGGFETGVDFASNGWNVSNIANNPWVVGSAVSNGAITGRSAYISNDAGVTNSYANGSIANNFFWKDVTVPAGETKIILSFNWIAQGESTWDNWQVFTAPTSVTPVSTTTYPGSGSTNVPAGIAGATFLGNGNLQGTVQTATYLLPSSLAGTTFRLIFSWKNDGGGGVQPPAVLDNISLVSQLPGTFISVTSGNWNTPSTWDANAVPTLVDNAIIDLGHTVSIDASGLAINDLTVRGTLGYGTTPTTFTVNGNLTVNAGGIFNVFNATTGKTLIVSKNITNNGTIDLSVGATTAGNLTLNGTAVQTVSGTGVFNTDVIRNITFSNTNTATPNINWLVNNVKVAYNLNLTGARINLGANKLTYGNNAAGNTLTAPVGTGFLSGGKFSRWWTATATGSAITAGADPTNATSRYPFINAAGENRAMYISRSSSTATGNTAGELAVVYTDGVGMTTSLSIVDGAYTITDRYNGHWTVSTEGSGYVYVSGTHTAVTIAQNAYVPSNGNTRIMTDLAVIAGTHQNGTVTPGAQRTGLSTADLTTVTGLYMGINNADIPFVSVQSGDWNNAATWNKGSLPTCSDAVVIASGHTVTNNSVGNVSKNVTINAGGILVMASGDLTVGCTLNNNPLLVNGTLSVNGGVLTINGNLSLASATAVFNQSGGTINIDGNAAGVIANSVASGTPLFNSVSTNINLTGGTLLFVDPHAATTNTNGYTIYLNNGTPTTTTLNTSALHTTQFGDGVSTDAGGHTSGFLINNWVGSAYLSLGSVIVNGGAGTNRMVTSTYQLTVNGNLTVNSSSVISLASALFIAGDFTINATGTYINTAATVTGLITSNTTTLLTTGPATIAQVFTNTGTCANLVTSPTANFASLTVNNTHPTGLTLASPYSVSGTLTLTAGLVNTNATNILTLGTATAAGTLTGGSAASYINGPFARTIASGNLNTNYIHYPVGKTAYAPVWLAPATTAVSILKSEAFDSNTGTVDASITSLSATRRWETPLVSGTITDINVRLGDASVVATSIPVQAPSASGIYTNAFGSIATFAAGTPNTTQSNTSVVSANYTGFLSLAISNACSGTPAPGNTISSMNNLCLGNSIALSLQNSTPGTGVTYVWESSNDGVSYSPISGAINATYATTPTADTYYRCQVTCSSNTGTSTPVHVIFANSITTITPGSRCGTGTVNLEATTSGGTVSWYDVTTGGTSIGTGSPFTTPSISTTTTYYAASEAITSGAVTLGAGATVPSSYEGIFYHLFGGVQTQFLVRASELAAIGLRAGNITSLSINMSSVSAQAYTDFAIGITNTANTAMAGLVTGPFTSVYNNATFSPTTGNNTFTFSTPYNWDGVSNIIVKMCWSNNNTGGTSNFARVDNPGFVSTAYYRSDGETSTTVCGATTATSTTSNRPQFIFAGQVACSGPRVSVVATVTPPPAFTLSTGAISTCQGTSTSLVTIATGAVDYDSYTWSPSLTVTGDQTNGWAFNPASSSSYVLTASQSSGLLCSTTASVDVTINPNPSTITVTPANDSVCVDEITSLTANGGTLSVVGTIGTATTLTGATAQPTAFCNRWPNYWSQTIYTAAELSAAGLVAGNITSLAYNVNSLGDAATNANFTVKIGTVVGAIFTTTTFLPSTSFTTVYGPATYTHTASGWNTIPFSTPYVWDGVSNIVIEVTHDGADNINNSQTYYTATTGNNTTLWVNSYTGSTTTGTYSVNRLNIRLTETNPTTIAWSPITNLYTDATATTPYVANANATTVYFKSSTAAPATNYTVTSTSSLSCTTTATVSVTVNALPSVTATSNDLDNTICSGTSVTLNGGGASTYLWTGSVTNGVGFIPSATGTYTVTGTDINGCSNTTTATINVNALPIVDATSDDLDNTLCANTSVTLSGSGASTYVWTGGVIDAASFVPVTTTTYTVTGTDLNGCTNTDTIMLSVNANPIQNLGADTTQCAGTITLDAGAGDNDYLWNDNSNSQTFIASISGTYSVLVTDSITGCFSNDTVIVTINPLPTVDLGLDSVQCGGSIALDAGNVGSTYLWNNSTIGQTLTATATGQYYVTVTNTFSCSSTDSVNIVILNLPVVNLGNDSTQCGGGIVLDAGAGNNDYLWNDNTTAQTLTVFVTGQYSVVVTDTLSGCIANDTINIALNQYPVVNLGADTTQCAGTIVLDADNAGASFLWSNTATTQTTTVTTTGQYSVAVTAAGCTTNDTINVTINALPLVGLSPFTTPICNDLTAYVLTNGSPSGGVYSGTNVTGNTFNSVTAGIGVHPITYTITDVNGCSNSSTQNITVQSCTGIEELNAYEVIVYPNPTSGVFTIAIKNANIDELIISVVDIQGKEIFGSRESNITADYNKQINLEGLSKGMYYIKLSTGSDVKIQKLIVQ